ncbi:hypothetical protein QBC37DRAFT_35839 [Rhypophila decipiens]|uniref:Uncharacterized protein n=1 Tax=Rhypophila decipiens TaxID=261697 RepID=A0AAN6Y0J3_9PEZI|nr:hypothetical protein QBC37DRAFT_35839 [Rhypophila decipiens]
MKLTLSAMLAATMLSLGNGLAIEQTGMTQFSRRSLLLLERQNVNQGRPIANGACCVPNTSKKQDVCQVNGVQGKCVPANTAGCGSALTCIQDSQLSCNDNVLENGRPLCRLTGPA